MEYKRILLEKKDHIAVLTLNNPENLNALTSELMEEILDALKNIEVDRETYCLVITGTGKGFIAGANLKELAALDAEGIYYYNKAILEVSHYLTYLRCPTIAAINGYTMGGGFELALACNMRIASTKAKFAFPEINLGFVPGGGGTSHLPKLIPVSTAMKLMLTGETIGADEALKLGVLEEVTEPEELMNAAMALAKTISSKAPLAAEAMKDVLLHGMNISLEESVHYTEEKEKFLSGTDDFHEGIHAFLEKRTPTFNRK